MAADRLHPQAARPISEEAQERLGAAVARYNEAGDALAALHPTDSAETASRLARAYVSAEEEFAAAVGIVTREQLGAS